MKFKFCSDNIQQLFKKVCDENDEQSLNYIKLTFNYSLANVVGEIPNEV